MILGSDYDTANSPAGAPLSYAQEQLWFIDQLSPGETTYNIMLTHRLLGSLDVDVLRECLGLVVARHDALRTTIRPREGIPYLVVAPPTRVELVVTDLSELAPAEREQALDAELRKRAGLSYDLEAGPLYRFHLFRLAASEHIFCECFNHIITDGWSVTVMNAEISGAYRALSEGRNPDFASLEYTYADFAREQRQQLRGAVLEDELRFWEERLARLPILELPADRPRPVDRAHRGHTVIRAFSPEVRDAAQRLADEQGVPLFMVLTAAVNVVLSHYTGLADIPLGVPMLGRPEPELEQVVGLFINMVVLRSDLSGDPSFAELLERITEANIELYEHQEVPFNLVVDRVQPVRDPGRNPLFQVSVQVLDGSTAGSGLAFPGVTAENVLQPSLRARYDIALNFYDAGDALKAAAEYSTDLFDGWRIDALLGHVETVLRAATADPGLRLSQLPLLTDDEREQLLRAGLGDLVSYREDPLHVAVATVAAARPDTVALVCRDRELTYGELDRRASQLARYLRHLGLRHGQVAAVVLDRDLDAYVAMLGVLKAGGAFCMMDPKYPVSRLSFMISDIAAPIVVSRSAFAGQLPPSSGWATVLLDTQWAAVEAMPATEPLKEYATRESMAYIIYTSGSTGTPKGVVIAHRGVALFADAYQRTFGLGPLDRLLQLPSLTFDMSQGEIWTALLIGATIVAVSPDEALSPEALSTLMREQRVTYAGLPPAILSVIDAGPYPDLKYVMGGAEVLPPELVNKWNLPGRRFVNLYGPTEAVIACTEYECEHTEWQKPPPIGRPHVNRQVYVVDQHGNLVPRGITGELLIGGDQGGLARGYLNQPELTAEKFIADPFNPGCRVYRSGDLVRWNSGCQLEILGRADDQVKLRGLRIELGEIEAALAAHADVGRAVVLMRPDRHGENRLIGYVSPAAGNRPDPQKLSVFLAESLPEYMVPTAWVVLDEFPLSFGWKINRKELPDPAEDQEPAPAVAPRTPTEEKVTSIFAEILGRQGVGAEDAFFRIGGNSLQAMRAISRINKTFGIKISIRLLYGGATVSTVSSAIDELLLHAGKA